MLIFRLEISNRAYRAKCKIRAMILMIITISLLKRLSVIEYQQKITYNGIFQITKLNGILYLHCLP